jgi:hypothetical protein
MLDYAPRIHILPLPRRRGPAEAERRRCWGASGSSRWFFENRTKGRKRLQPSEAAFFARRGSVVRRQRERIRCAEGTNADWWE